MSKEAMKLALEALVNFKNDEIDAVESFEQCEAAITALREALAEQPAPVQRKATTYAERFAHAVAVLCGAQPPADMVAEWIANTEVNGEHRLQGWVLTQAATPFWAQGIVVLDAAHVLANDPEEGEGHDAAPQPAQQEPVAGLLVGQDSDGRYVSISAKAHADTLPLGEYDLYTSPPAQRKPLTDEQIRRIELAVHGYTRQPLDVRSFARAIEAAHGIKENT